MLHTESLDSWYERNRKYIWSDIKNKILIVKTDINIYIFIGVCEIHQAIIIKSQNFLINNYFHLKEREWLWEDKNGEAKQYEDGKEELGISIFNFKQSSFN